MDTTTLRTADPVADRPAAGRPLAGRPVAGRAVAGRTGPGRAAARSAGSAPAAARRRSRRLGGRARKALLLLHILAAGVWLGVDVIVGALVLGSAVSDDLRVAGVAYQALGTFVLVPMLVAGLVCLVSGVVLGLGSKYGLVRYTWVAIKLVLNVVLCVLILALLRPSLAEVAGYGRDLAAGATGGAAPPEVSSLPFPPVVSLVALTFASWLSVFKPWGRTRFGR
jgi:hypothetical protein